MKLSFPFLRGPWYSFTEFTAFEDQLLVARREDKDLDLALGVGRERWMKLRNNELYPLFYFARHLGIEADASFKICADGAEADVELMHGTCIRQLQVTTAGPLWPAEENWGRDYVLHMEKLKVEGEVTGTGPFRREADGSISNRTEAISTAERNPPYLAGLVEALRGKQRHRLPDCELLVYAGTYCQMMSRESFLDLARAALATVPIEGFAKIHIFDSDEGFIITTEGVVRPT
jgi:hypothetical protein